MKVRSHARRRAWRYRLVLHASVFCNGMPPMALALRFCSSDSVCLRFPAVYSGHQVMVNYGPVQGHSRTPRFG